MMIWLKPNWLMIAGVKKLKMLIPNFLWKFPHVQAVWECVNVISKLWMYNTSVDKISKTICFLCNTHCFVSSSFCCVRILPLRSVAHQNLVHIRFRICDALQKQRWNFLFGCIVGCTLNIFSLRNIIFCTPEGFPKWIDPSGKSPNKTPSEPHVFSWPLATFLPNTSWAPTLLPDNNNNKGCTCVSDG